MTKHIANILIVEDEELFASKMEMQIDKLGHRCVGIVDNREEAIALIEQNDITLVLMDININGDYDGVELAQEIKTISKASILFITSNHDDQSFKRANRVGAVGFITKPFTDIQLQRMIELAITNKKKGEEAGDSPYEDIRDGILFIKKNNQIAKVNIDDIYYIEADGKYTRIYTKGDIYMVRKPFKTMTERLVSYHFVQCHRSYAVNLKKIKSINIEESVIVLEERSVPLSRREKDQLIEKLNYLV